MIQQRSTSLFYSTAQRNFSNSVKISSPKLFDNAEKALKASNIKDGYKVLVGGFGLCGIPMALIQEIQKKNVKDLTIVSNNCGVDDWGLGILLKNDQIKKIIASYVGENKTFEKKYLTGQIEVELTPQGTLAERLRAGGAGIPGFYTRTGYGTIMHDGNCPMLFDKNGKVLKTSTKKESKSFNGKDYLLEEAITGDVSIIKGYKCDQFGNVVFRGTARNFNPECAKAAKFCIVEVEEIVENGTIKPEDVHLPGIYVDAILVANEEKRIERKTTMDNMLLSKSNNNTNDNDENNRIKIAKRAAKELKNNMCVNLGIGIPSLASNYIPSSVNVMLQSENGLLGLGPYPKDESKLDPDYINAGKETITTLKSSSIFSSSESFGMVRGKHIDMTILGAFEVASNGDLANWIIPSKLVKGPGGAMDLVSSGSYVIVVTEHCDKKGKSKLLKKCSLPLTGVSVVDKIITERAVFDVDKKNNVLILKEVAEGYTVDDILKCTEATVVLDKNGVIPMQQ